MLLRKPISEITDASLDETIGNIEAEGIADHSARIPHIVPALLLGRIGATAVEQLANWDVDYINNVVLPSPETDQLEKKSLGSFSLRTNGQPDGACKEELAKQVSAFSNSGGGFVVYGLTDQNGVDAGIPTAIGRQPIKDWIEEAIPDMLYPTVSGCQARSIQLPGIHAADRCILVVSISLSDRRPHWSVVGTNDIAYIRAGAHSSPMRPQSLLDIASRQSASAAEILDMRIVKTPNVRLPIRTYFIRPAVRLINGSLCRQWSLELRSKNDGRQVTLAPSLKNAVAVNESDYQYIIGKEPLFPGRATPVVDSAIEVSWYQQNADENDFEVEATLYLESGARTTRIFRLRDIDPSHDAIASVTAPSR